ncbi:MAG: bifunctional methylenetetrahydrofolate dehydrogenase/methenyltetrahydrofolate cyclohydrolase FolD [Rubinisphaera brasiliensis]|uniref:bifunctional methylenetetrahydrofolate dehydrogenase/methenyltetrahydrofolate cyclohydrolase FolD n=1 Tax=Rubinisphaera brasiliensis TaxID=119 RepID=UPI00391BF685
MSASIIDGRAIAAQLRSDVQQDVERFVAETGVTPHLSVVLVGENPASQVYVRNKEKFCVAAGMKSTVHRLSAETTQDELLQLVNELNNAEDVHGILVQLPLPSQIDEQAILDAICSEKDVDAFHPHNVGLLVQGRSRFEPCTPAGCLQLIRSVREDISGLHAVVLGRSEIVGKPMSLLLIQRGADCTVTICHSRTKDLAEITKQADILIAAIGKPNFVTADMVKPGAIVIDVGINRVDKKLVGDVDYDAVAEKADAITPVPGGVGPMTIANLLRNSLRAAQMQTQARRQ